MLGFISWDSKQSTWLQLTPPRWQREVELPRRELRALYLAGPFSLPPSLWCTWSFSLVTRLEVSQITLEGRWDQSPFLQVPTKPDVDGLENATPSIQWRDSICNRTMKLKKPKWSEEGCHDASKQLSTGESPSLPGPSCGFLNVTVEVKVLKDNLVHLRVGISQVTRQLIFRLKKQ